MKTTQEQAKRTLKIDGSLLDALLNGGVIVSYKFNGWDWYVLVKHSKENWKVCDDKIYGQRAFQYTEFHTLNSCDISFYEAIHRNGTPKEVLGKFNKGFYEEKFQKERAFELGNID